MNERIPANVPVEIYISKSISLLENVVTFPIVAVLPDYNTWNDYGRNFFAKLIIKTTAQNCLVIHLRMMFEGANRSETIFNEMFNQEGELFTIDRINRQFISLIPEVEGYRKVIKTLGFDVGISALRKLRDAVILRIEGEDEEGLRLFASEDFHFGALRDDSAYAALQRGSRFFRRAQIETLDDAAINLIFTTHLKCSDNRYTLPLYFAQNKIFRNRISVLIGRNGVGKTQLLKSMVDGLCINDNQKQNKSRFFPTFRPTRVLVFSSVYSDYFPKSIGSWHGIDYEYFPITYQRSGALDPVLSALVSCKKAYSQLIFGLDKEKSRLDVIQESLITIGIWHKLYFPLRGRKEGDELPNVLKVGGKSYFRVGEWLNERNLIRLVQQIDWTRSLVIFNEENEPRDLSSGEYAMLRFAALAAASIEQGSLLLFDEPETHLHPNFVSDLMEILDNLLQSTKSVAIIATHSAYVVREVPRDRVNILTLENKTVRIDSPRLQTFGATVDTISQFVFGDTNISHQYQKTLTQWAEKFGRELGIEGVIQQFGQEFNSESLSFIARVLSQPPEEGTDLSAPQADQK